MNLLKFKKKNEKQIIIQEDKDACVSLIENTFKNIFNESVTDLSYNGDSFFACNNDIGRYKLDIKMSKDEALSFIKKIANYMLKPFSTKEPFLDVSFGDYRLNAIHPSLARTNNEKVVTFSLRKVVAYLRINKGDRNLCPLEIHNLLEAFINSYQSILISGQTGSGKTEFQKYLVSLMNNKDRVILIEDSYETHLKEIFKDMDITSWVVDPQTNTYKNLIKEAMRNNPDWLIVAETRGKEVDSFVETIKTGHSGITTIHSEKAKFSLDRVLDMKLKNNDFDEKIFLSTLAKSIKIGIHMEKIYSNTYKKYIRRISEIVEYISTKDGYEINCLFEIIKDESLKETYVYGKISDNLKRIFIKHDIDLKTINLFI